MLFMNAENCSRTARALMTPETAAPVTSLYGVSLSEVSPSSLMTLASMCEEIIDGMDLDAAVADRMRAVPESLWAAVESVEA